MSPSDMDCFRGIFFTQGDGIGIPNSQHSSMLRVLPFHLGIVTPCQYSAGRLWDVMAFGYQDVYPVATS